MEIKRVALVLVDISGYTRFMLQGDAAFLYAVLDGEEAAVAKDILRQVTRFFEAFEDREVALIACDACVCDACSQIGQLKLKAFLHVGQAAFKKIRQFEGIGDVAVRVYYPPPAEPLPARPAPGPPLPGTDYGALSGRFNRYAVRRILSRQPPHAFSHLPNPTLTPLQLWSYFVMGIGGNVVATLRHRLTRKS